MFSYMHAHVKPDIKLTSGINIKCRYDAHKTFSTFRGKQVPKMEVTESPI